VRVKKHNTSTRRPKNFPFIAVEAAKWIPALMVSGTTREKIGTPHVLCQYLACLLWYHSLYRKRPVLMGLSAFWGSGRRWDDSDTATLARTRKRTQHSTKTRLSEIIHQEKLKILFYTLFNFLTKKLKKVKKS